MIMVLDQHHLVGWGGCDDRGARRFTISRCTRLPRVYQSPRLVPGTSDLFLPSFRLVALLLRSEDALGRMGGTSTRVGVEFLISSTFFNIRSPTRVLLLSITSITPSRPSRTSTPIPSYPSISFSTDLSHYYY